MVGGTIFFREKVTDTIQRVALEEIGTTVIVKKSLSYIEYFSEVVERGFGYTISLVFLCELPKKFDLVLDDQVEKYGFFKEAPSNTVVEQKEFIEKLV